VAPSTEKSDVAPDQLLQQQQEKPPELVDKPPEPVEPEPQPPQKAEVELPPLPKPIAKPVQKQMAAVNTRPVAADKVAEHAAAPSPGERGRAKAEWGSLISAHLNRYKNVPAGLRAPGGVVMLAFTLDRQGRVMSSHVAQGSGLGELDREAVDMLRRAQPFPPPPSELTGSQFPFTVPVRYTVR
jgi:periplasmic protein TonB